jgi:hypothetical protein
LEGGEQEAVESKQTQPQLASAPSPEEIQLRAYELHLERGRLHGWDQDDWLQAEQDLMEKHHAR